MLILSQSQAKNYLTKLHPFSNNEGCGCCHNSTYYIINNRRIIQISSGENVGNHYTIYNVIAIIKKMKDRSN
jgi:hypothetical protein